VGARAIGEELELLFLDPVFHLPTGTIQIFVQGSRLPVLRSERGDDETGILPLGQIFGLAHHAPLTGPTLASLITKVLEPPRRFPAGLIGPPGLCQLTGNDLGETAVLGQPQHVFDPMALAPTHDRLAAETAIPPQHDPHLGPGARACATIRESSSTHPVAGSSSASRKRAQSNRSPQKKYNGR